MGIRYRVYGEETGVLPLRQSVKETINSPHNSEPLGITNKPRNGTTFFDAFERKP